MPKAYDDTKRMLILRGINNLLDEQSAMDYASLRGYEGYVLKVSGETGPTSTQVQRALTVMNAVQPPFQALYGFSGGGYNVRHIINRLNYEARAALELVVVLGAPKLEREAVEGTWELVYRLDPIPSEGGHMAGPKELLKELREHAAG